MTVIPTGFSLVTLTHNTPSTGGLRESVVTLACQDFPSDILCEGIAQAWLDMVWSQFGADESYFTGCTMRDMINVAEFSFNEEGNTTGDQEAPQASLLVRKNTGRAGRRFRGRMYPPSQVYTATYDRGGTMTGGSLDAYQAGYDNFYDSFSAVASEPYLLHNDETAPTAITSFLVDPRVATQRRRTGR